MEARVESPAEGKVENKVQIHRGLKGVYFDRSRVCDIDGRAGELWYRGYSIHDLAQRSTFEETCYLLFHGELPGADELARFSSLLRAARVLPPAILEIIGVVKDAHPMDALRTAVSALAAFDPDVADNSPEATLRKGIRLTSQVPMIIAAHEHVRNGRAPVAPDPALGHAANFLYMLKGKRPSEDAARLMDIDMILHAEHGSNASAFTARVVAGTEANLHAAMTAAIAALSGPAHGGAAENVMKMAQEMGEPKWFQILAALVEAMKPYARHGVNVNVDFYAGVVYYLNGIAPDLFVPIFAVGRVPGWTVQVLEQMESNILIRPLTLYNGPEQRPYVPIE